LSAACLVARIIAAQRCIRVGLERGGSDRMLSWGDACTARVLD
jgi:hypothetical protein